MTDPKIVASGKDSGRRASTRAHDHSGAWAALGWIGLAFLVVGGADFALTWFPLEFGNPEWEFGTVTASFNGLPILLLGLGMLVVAATELGRRWWGILGMLVAVVLLVWILGGFALWATNVSLAFQTVPEGLVVGVRRSVTKTVVQAVVFEALVVYLLWRAWAGPKQAEA